MLVTPVQLAITSDFQAHSALVISTRFVVVNYRDKMMMGASVPKAEVTLGINYLQLSSFLLCAHSMAQCAYGKLESPYV